MFYTHNSNQNLLKNIIPGTPKLAAVGAGVAAPFDPFPEAFFSALSADLFLPLVSLIDNPRFYVTVIILSQIKSKVRFKKITHKLTAYNNPLLSNNT